MRWADRRICFLIYHAEFEHEVSIWQVRVWKADLEDLLPYISRGDRTQSWNALRYCWWHWWLCWSENNHLWPSYYCIFIVFPFGDYSCSSGSSSPSILFDHSEEKRHKSHLERASELSAFVSFWVYLWVHVYTLVSGVHTVFYKPCWWVYMVEWTL